VDSLKHLRPTGRDGEIEALLVLDALPGVGPAAFRSLVSAFGSAERALAQGSKAMGRMVGSKAVRSLGDPRIRAAVREALEVARRLDMRVVAAGDPEYPPRLLHLADPPPVLFLRGDVGLLSRPGVAVVGSRKATTRARDVATRLGRAIAGTGTPVVSGLALGVDGAAHRGALEVHGPTVAVLGRGADRPYPRSHASLFRSVLSEGLVVSEFPPGTPPLPHHFPRRNRVLAALGFAVVVVEARARSGALITVEHALDLGLDVWAVPGPIDEPTCAGSNALLVDGAKPLVSVDGFVEECLSVDPGAADPVRDSLGPDEDLVLELLEEGPRSADEIATAADLDVTRALRVLSDLELRGRISRAPGMSFRRAG
jgi:DNA processing protein